MVLRQHPLARAGLVACWVAAGVVPWAFADVRSAIPAVVLGLWVPACLWAAWRAQGMAVVLRREDLVIRWFRRVDRIPRSVVIGADESSGILVRAPAAPGRRRVIIVSFFEGRFPMLPFVVDHNELQMRAIDQWASAQRLPPGGGSAPR